MAEEAMIQTNNENKPTLIMQDYEPPETPMQQEPKEPVHPVHRSRRIQNQLLGNYFQRPPTAANIRKEAQYYVLGNALLDTNDSTVPTNLINNKLNMSPAIDLEAM